MRTVVLGPPPAELEALIALRRSRGADLYDEIWAGEYHMAPAPHPTHGYLDDQFAHVLRGPARAVGLVGTGPFNLGTSDDYRVPDRGLHRGLPTTAFVATAALVVEIVSPNDETWDKLGFYARHDVDEIAVADPATRRLTWLRRSDDGGYAETISSPLLAIDVAVVADQIDWPRFD